MIAEKENLIVFIETDRRQFIIPIYQRKYKWTNEQCSRLIDDIIKCGKNDVEHFTGTVVTKQTGTSFRKAYLVDGQQRITTIMLMLKSLAIISEVNLDIPDYQYVYNSTKKCMYADQNDISRGLKIIPSKNDQVIYNTIMNCHSLKELEDNPIIDKDKDNLLFNNFKYIYQRFLSEIENGLNIKSLLFQGMLNLTIVDMTLEAGDDPQEIFESINSLGIRLTNSDLIRNYLLMSNKDQEQLYTNYWEPMQDNLIGEKNMESFVSDYLLMKKSYSINVGDVYKEYVSYSLTIGDGENNRNELLKDLYNVALIYQPFIRECPQYSAQTNMLMQELRDMAQTTINPFLMKVFIDKQNGIIDEGTLDKVINLIIVYLVRRSICKVPTNSLRGFMLTLYNRVFDKVMENKNRYYESIYAFLNIVSSRDRLLTYKETLDNLLLYPLYKNAKFATYILYKIENGRYPNPYKEFVTAKSVTIEHIMPQNLSDDWIISLGPNAEEIHEKYIDTLGNLSLSSRSKNSTMSDESFNEKKKILLADGSKFEVLNKSIKHLNKFTEEEIINREKELAEILLDKYKIEDVDITGIRFEDVVEVMCSVEFNTIFKGAKPVAFKLFGIEYNVEFYNQILVNVIKILLRKYPEKIRSLASEHYSPWNGEVKYLYYTDDESMQEIDEGIRVNTNLNANDIIYFLAYILIECDIEPEELMIYLKKESLKNN